MEPALGAAGCAALAATMRRRPLLAFDFDGTLARIVARPDDARLTPAVATRLEALAARLPLAIVTGRSVSDVRGRLGFVPRYIVGSHGAEDEFDPVGSAQRIAVLDPLRIVLASRGRDVERAGVQVEDKQQSIALHYRLAPDHEAARTLIDELVAAPCTALRVFPGKMVVNVVAARAPDKGDAVSALALRCGAASVFFAGDDRNDEPVFACAGPDWFTVRVGRDDPDSRARFCVDRHEDVARLLERMLNFAP